MKAIKKYFESYLPLLQELVKRDLKLKYRRSALGYVWSLLNPLLMMVIMTLVFSHMFRFEIENYPIYLICGQMFFNFFNESTNTAMYSVIQNGALLKKIYVPKYIFPISRVFSNFVTMSSNLAAVLIVMIATRVPFHWTVLLFWAPLLMLLVFSCGMGMILSALSVKFRDVTHLYGVLTMAWMYATPIFYPIAALPDKVAALVRLNPLYSIITVFRDLILYGRLSSAGLWLYGAGSAVVMMAIGAVVFAKMQRDFIYYI